MVGVAKGGIGLALLVALAAVPVAAQTPLPLKDVGARDASADFAPKFLNHRVVIRGVVNSPAFHFPDHSLLTFEDGNYGAVLRVNRGDDRLDAYHPGDEIQAVGVVAAFAGMPVVLPESIVKTGVKPAPTPIEVPLNALLGFRYLGRLVRAEAVAQTIADSANGGYISVNAPEKFLVFLPRAANQSTVLSGLAAGDRVHVTGVAFQYCARPPFNRYFQLLVQDPAYIVPLPKGFFPPAVALGSALAIVLLIGFFVWSRERRVRKQRERLRKTYKIGEEVLAADSAGCVLQRLRLALPEILNVGGAHLYTLNRTARTLDAVELDGEPQSSLPLTLTPGETTPAAVWCFQYHTPLAIPDPERSPFAFRKDKARPAKSVLFVPMVAQGEAVGVLQLDRHSRRARTFTEGEQELAQHLANQAGVAMRLLEQRTVQEQLFRTEKLAAVGRLISSVVNELRAPLESIQELSGRALGKAYNAAAERELGAIEMEAQKAAGIVARLVSYASLDPSDARPVDIGGVLRKLIEFREGDWKASGIRVRDLTNPELLPVLGSQEQLEQVFLNLLVHAEQALAEAPQKIITVRSSVMAKRLLVEIAFSSGPISRNMGETAGVLGVTRGVVGGHGGEVRLIEKNNTEPRFEIELPLASRERTGALPTPPGPGRPVDPSRRLTALVVENEEAAQRQLVGLLSGRGFRVVPVDNADTGLDLAHRMKFDAAFCSVHAPGLNWVELSERMHSRTEVFVLVSDRYDRELAADFEGEGRLVLARPIEDEALDRVMRILDPPIRAVKNRTA
jgi:GAF domain-containing protein/CheY-like chemotaxis protein